MVCARSLLLWSIKSRDVDLKISKRTITVFHTEKDCTICSWKFLEIRPRIFRLGNLNFLCNFSQLPLCSICLFTVLFRADVDFFIFLACSLVRDLFSSGCRNNYPPPSSPTCPVLSHTYVFCPYPQFFNTSDTDLLEISACLKLVLVPFSSLLLTYCAVIIFEQKCRLTYSSVISVCISNNLPADLNTLIHVTSVFFLPDRGGGSLMAEACRAYPA